MAFSAVLTSDLTSTDEIIHVDTNLDARTTYPWRLLIDNEALYVTAGVEEGLDWTVLRGADDTDPADHASGTPVLAAPLESQVALLTDSTTAEGHVFRGETDPVDNPDFAPPFLQPGDLWIDTSVDPPFAHLIRDATNTTWLPAPMVAKDANGDPAGIVRASASVDSAGLVALRTFDALGVAAHTLLLDADGSFGVSNDDGSVGIGILADGTIFINQGNAAYGITATGMIQISNGAQSATLELATNGGVTLSGANGGVAIDAAGAAVITGTAFTLSGLPTADPVVAGQLWNDSGTVKVSAG